MEARLPSLFVVVALFGSLGAGYRTANFVVEAPTNELAKEIGDTAEKFRDDLAMEWLGKTMPKWSHPCPITAKVSPELGAGGATTFVFEHNEVYGWQMNIQGSRERVLDSVLPHEITHTVFASHFRRPLPRWADEGACTTVEHTSEKAKQQKLLITFLQTGRGIAFNQLFAMKEYPKDVLPLYSEGYSLARYLIDQGGRRKFVGFVEDGLKSDNWPAATRKAYGYSDLSNLQTEWLAWVKQGSPTVAARENANPAASPERPTEIAAKSNNSARPAYRAQSEDRPLVADAAATDQQMVPITYPQRPLTANGSGIAALPSGPPAPSTKVAAPRKNFFDESSPSDTAGEKSRYVRTPGTPEMSASTTAPRVLFEWSRAGTAE